MLWNHVWILNCFRLFTIVVVVVVVVVLFNGHDVCMRRIRKTRMIESANHRIKSSSTNFAHFHLKAKKVVLVFKRFLLFFAVFFLVFELLIWLWKDVCYWYQVKKKKWSWFFNGWKEVFTCLLCHIIKFYRLHSHLCAFKFWCKPLIN